VAAAASTPDRYPQAILATILMAWWPKDEEAWNKYAKVVIPYTAVVLLFYFFYLR
jgi:hypothetical protein